MLIWGIGLASQSTSTWVSSMILRLESMEWTFIVACECSLSSDKNDMSRTSHTDFTVGLDQASVSPSADDVKARLAQATVSTKPRPSSGSRTASKVSSGVIVVKSINTSVAGMCSQHEMVHFN